MTELHAGASYEKPLHLPETRDVIIKELQLALVDKADQFDGFVVQGYSMTIIGSILAFVMGKQLAVVRKESDKRYSGYDVEGKHHQRWVFVDDIICSGRTFKRVKDGITTINGTIEAICLWHSQGYTNDEGVPVWMARHLPIEWDVERENKYK